MSSLFVATASGPPDREPSTTSDWNDFRAKVLQRIDVAAEYAGFDGLRLVNVTPDAKGKCACHAIDRPDDQASAFINVRTGFYFDSGSGEKALSLFDFALKHGGFGRFIDMAKHYSAKTGVPLPDHTVRSKGRIHEVHYDYLREDGSVAYRVNRYILPNGGKDFTQHPPDGKGGWRFGAGCMDGVEPVPFRLPELLAADADDPVFICEGEKAALAVVGLGLVATTAHGGSSNADKAWSVIASRFAGRDCYILPDNDRPGRSCATRVAARLSFHARTLKVLELPGLPHKGDAVEWIDGGGTAEELCRLAHAAPAWSIDRPIPEKSSQNTRNESESAQTEDDGNFESASSGNDWGTPRLYRPANPAPFPLHVLPPMLADHVALVSERMGCPLDYPALAAIGVASGAIGRSVTLIIRNDWHEQAVLYLALVGSPGMAKSPALGSFARPLFQITGELIADHKARMERWKRERDVDGGEPQPLLRQVLVDDATVESISPILQDNPRGIVMVRDELSALFSGMNQYKAGGKGADRQFFLKVWSGSAISVHRKGNADRVPFFVANPFMSIVGGMTPDMLSEMAEGKGRNDGFMDRLLFCLPAPVQVRWHDEGVPAERAREWDDVVRALWDAPQDTDLEGKSRPHFVRFTPEAKAIWAAWHDGHMVESEGEDFADHLIGSWSKYRSCCARLALVLDRLGRAYDPEWDGHPADVEASSLRAAIELVDYFKAHAERVHATIRGSGSENLRAHALIRWVRSTGRARFSERDVRQNFRRRFPQGGPELDDTLRWLVARDCIRPAPAPVKSGPGRKPTPEYEVNPALMGYPVDPIPRAS